MSTDRGPAFGPEGLERRRAPRIPIPPSAPLFVVGARLLNASAFGMMIESPVAIEPDAILRFRLVIAREKFDVETRVAACSGGRGTKNAFAIGLEFTSLPEGARTRLQGVLNELAAPRQKSA